MKKIFRGERKGVGHFVLMLGGLRYPPYAIYEFAWAIRTRPLLLGELLSVGHAIREEILHP